MAKVSIKSEKITPFGGIFHVRELYLNQPRDCGVLQPQGRQGTHLRRHEQRIRMGKAAKVIHGREHRVPAADGYDTQLL